MIKQFEIKGRWKLPNDETWLNGILRFSPTDGADLEIFGSLVRNISENQIKEIIIGETTEGNITLVDSLYKSSKYTTNNAFITEIYRSDFILIGNHFESIQDIKFNSVVFKSFNLFEWFDSKGITHDFKNLKQGYSIHYSTPKTIEFDFFKGCNGQITFQSPINLSHISNKIEIEESCSVKLIYSELRNLKDILMDLHIFSGFITLSTFEQSYPTSITLTDDKYSNDQQAKYISCHFQNSSYSSKYKNQRKYQHLVKYEDIRSDFPKIITNWHQKYLEIKPVFNLMLYSFRDKLKFNEDKFMDIIRALETFHRRTQNNSKILPSEFELLTKRILDKIDINDKDWLKEKLKYANEPSLRKRLTDLFELYSDSLLKSKISNIDKFCTNVIDSRNYHTHYNHELEGKAFKGKGLFELNQNLKALLISCILKYIGLKSDSIENGLKRSLLVN